MAAVSRPESLIFGLLLILLGIAWTLSNLGRIDLLATVRTWWPLALVAWGALELFNAISKRRMR